MLTCHLKTLKMEEQRQLTVNRKKEMENTMKQKTEKQQRNINEIKAFK